MTDIYLIYRRALKEARTSKKVTQMQLAKATKYNHITISKIENGRQFPRLHHAVAMANYLGFSMNILQEDVKVEKRG